MPQAGSAPIHLQTPAPPSDPVKPLLLREALEEEGGRGPVSPLPAETDVCVVGGGFTGLWTAIHAKLSEPGARVAVIEAGLCGGGASGRNGGFLMSAWSKIASLAKSCGRAEALMYATAVEKAIQEIGSFCTDHGIDAEFAQAGWVWAATNADQVGAWDGTLQTLSAFGAEPFRRLSASDTVAMTGSPTHLAGIFEPLTATINPGRLVRGLRRVAEGLGIAVCEQTAVTRIEETPAPVLTTSKGTVRTQTAVLATSAWAASLPKLAEQLVVVASDVVATDPIPARLDALGVKRGISISDSRRAVHYYRVSKDGRMIFGKGGGGVARARTVGGRFEESLSRAVEVRRQMRRIYPTLWDVPVPYSWRGAVDYALSGLPFIGVLPGSERVLIATGFSGNGLTPSYVAGRHLASLALERGGEAVPEGLGVMPSRKLPPEPLLFIGGEIVRRAVERRERSEDQEREPSRATKLVAGLDPTSFVDSSAPPAGPFSAAEIGSSRETAAAVGGRS
jgi:glycine/D-amino acid oxidase-like deaminating enzyme